MAVLDLRLEPTKNELRYFGLTIWSFLAIVAGVVYLNSGSERAATILLGLGGAFCVVYYALRPLRVPLYRLWMRALYPIGWLISHVVLVSIYYLAFTPIGLVLRIVGYDPLKRRFDREAETYWSPRAPAERPEQYFRQF